MINNKSIINTLGTIVYNKQEIINIFNRVKLDEKTLSNIKYYDEYIIQEGDRWDIISNNFYGTPQLYWLILSYNKIKDPFTSLIIGNTIRLIKPSYIPYILLDLRKT